MFCEIASMKWNGICLWESAGLIFDVSMALGLYRR